ncbi:MAG: hypothetical protein ACRYFX_07340 [Janthinobacterium lividum]
MPIRRRNYPKGWDTVIRPRICERDGWRCTKCDLPDHAVGYRDERGHFMPLDGSAEYAAAGVGRTWPELERLSFRQADHLRNHLNKEQHLGQHWFVVLLSVAHRDHALKNHADENLHCLCQQCHIRYDKHVSGPKAGYTRKYTRTSGVLDFSQPLSW